MADGTGHHEPGTVPTAVQIEAAWSNPKLANVLYHDWEAGSYDQKWSISYDERCIVYARDRFAAVAGTEGWPYATALELGQLRLQVLAAAVRRGSDAVARRPAVALLQRLHHRPKAAGARPHTRMNVPLARTYRANGPFILSGYETMGRWLIRCREPVRKPSERAVVSNRLRMNVPFARTYRANGTFIPKKAGG